MDTDMVQLEALERLTQVAGWSELVTSPQWLLYTVQTVVDNSELLVFSRPTAGPPQHWTIHKIRY